MNRTVKWLAIIGCMIGYGELRVVSITAAGIGVIIATCALIYTINDIPSPADGKKRIVDEKRRAELKRREANAK